MNGLHGAKAGVLLVKVNVGILHVNATKHAAIDSVFTLLLGHGLIMTYL